MHEYIVGLLLLEPVPVDLLTFLESRERLTAYRFLDQERRSLGHASGAVDQPMATNELRSRIVSTGSLIDAVTVQDFAIIKVLGQVRFLASLFVSFYEDIGIIWACVLSATNWWPTLEFVCNEGLQNVLHYKCYSYICFQVLRKGEVVKRRQVEHTLTERHIMATVQHSFVLGLRVAFQSDERLFMLTDYCPGGELFFHLKKMRRYLFFFIKLIYSNFV